MSNAKHTRGPWECDPIGHEVYETERMTVIATLPPVRTIADARLIASAPELLDMLKRSAMVIEALSEKLGEPNHPRIHDINAVIAKAMGGAYVA